MSLLEYHWEQHDLRKTKYAGKYVTHDNVNKQSIIDQIEDTELSLKDHTLQYEGVEMDVRLDVTNDYAVFFYDETFEKELGQTDIEDVILYFLTPEEYRYHYTEL